MKILICSIAALTLSVCTMNAQQDVDAANANKTQVVKKADKTQEVKKTNVVKSRKASNNVVMSEDTDGNTAELKKSQLAIDKAAKKEKEAKSKPRRVVRKEAQAVKKSESELISEKKAKQTVKKVDN